MSVFLFTDMEGSTLLWESHQQEMSHVLARHDAIIGEQVREHGGKVVKSLGDGTFAVFEAGNPLGCALEIQKQIQQHDWGTVGPVRIRIALYAGEAESRDGDYFGPAVNRAARLVAAAWGGQILLTPEVLAVAPLPDDTTLEDYGAHLLKDLGEAQHIYGLLHPTLGQQKFPPLRTLSARPNNLPTQPTPFLGRTEELNEVGKRLLSPQCRLLTVMGPGGMGKTRLAIQVGADQIDEFPDGVFFVALAPLSGVEFIAPAITDAMGIILKGRDDPRYQLLQALRPKQLLLVLDNFEHLIEGADLIAEILVHAPNVKLMATSRERLNLRGEWLFELKGMDIPEGGDSDEIEESSAVQLFLQGARRVMPEFTVDDATRDSILKICRLVEGVPLGIELAASWVRMLSCEEIVQEIERSLDFLEVTTHDVPDRHRSLRAVFDYSWQLLTEPEKMILRKVAIFRGGFRREAAAQVASASLMQLSALVNKSLLSKTANNRYELHEILRHYAAEKLAEVHDLDTQVREAHSTYYMNLLYEQEPNLRGERQTETLRDLSLEIENLRVAWRWATEHGDAQSLSRALPAFYRFYEVRGWFQEGDEAISRAVECLSRPTDKLNTSDRVERVGMLERALSFQGRLVYRLGDFARARNLFRKSLGLARDTGHHEEMALALNNLGSIAYALGEYEEAQQRHQESLALYRQMDDLPGVADALNNLGVTAESRGAYLEAQRFFKEARQMFERLEDTRGVAKTLINQGLVAEALHQYTLAKQHYQEALAICQEIGDRWGIAISLDNLGYAAAELREDEEAQRYFMEALRAASAIGTTPVIVDVFVGLAISLMRTGQIEKGLNLLMVALRHPSIVQKTRQRAESLLAEFESRVPAATINKARVNTIALSVEELVDGLIREQGAMP